MSEILNLIGLMYRANKLLIGDNIFENMDKVLYLFVASDISEKSLLRYQKKCHYYHIELNQQFNSVQLSNCLGKRNTKALAIIDEGFYKTLINKINKGGING